MVEQRALTGDRHAPEILGLARDQERRRAMSQAARALARPDAARVIVDRIVDLAARGGRP
jgi:UDP-N-acetylglucosamine:LPS N-acetylglucosamine transferase